MLCLLTVIACCAYGVLIEGENVYGLDTIIYEKAKDNVHPDDIQICFQSPSNVTWSKEVNEDYSGQYSVIFVPEINGKVETQDGHAPYCSVFENLTDKDEDDEIKSWLSTSYFVEINDVEHSLNVE